MNTIKVNKDNFETEVMKSNQPVLVDFWASWCGPCKMVGPIIDEISNEREDIKVCKINIDEEPELAASFNVMSIPTLMVFNKGNIVTKTVGAHPKSGILSMIDEAAI